MIYFEYILVQRYPLPSIHLDDPVYNACSDILEGLGVDSALLVLVGSGAAKTIKVDWDAAAGQTLTAENGDWIEFKSASSSGW